jgi:hypothetical protein
LGSEFVGGTCFTPGLVGGPLGELALAELFEDFLLLGGFGEGGAGFIYFLLLGLDFLEQVEAFALHPEHVSAVGGEVGHVEFADEVVVAYVGCTSLHFFFDAADHGLEAGEFGLDEGEVALALLFDALAVAEDGFEVEEEAGQSGLLDDQNQFRVRSAG